MAKAKQKNIIITCAVTGSTLTPSMSPYLPVTPDRVFAALEKRARGRKTNGGSA